MSTRVNAAGDSLIMAAGVIDDDPFNRQGLDVAHTELFAQRIVSKFTDAGCTTVNVNNLTISLAMMAMAVEFFGATLCVWKPGSTHRVVLHDFFNSFFK